jgi:hypothetical protein
MKGLSRQQLDAVFMMTGHGPTRGDDHVIFLGELERIYEEFGDDYYEDQETFTDLWELCEENSAWDEARKNGSIGIMKGYKVRR